MNCSICEEVSQVPTGTRIPTAFINTLWDRRLESGRQPELDLSPQGSAAASQADGSSGGEHLPREHGICPFEIRQFKRSHRNCELSGSTPIQLPDRFRVLSLSLFYMFAVPDEWGCVYSQSVYTGKLGKGLYSADDS